LASPVACPKITGYIVSKLCLNYDSKELHTTIQSLTFLFYFSLAPISFPLSPISQMILALSLMMTLGVSRVRGYPKYHIFCYYW